MECGENCQHGLAASGVQLVERWGAVVVKSDAVTG